MTIRIRSLGALAAAAAFCSLAFAQEARAAGTYCYSSATYDPATTKINGYSYTEPDYATTYYYYQCYVDAALTDQTGNVIRNPAAVIGYGARAEVRVHAYASADTRYTMSAGHALYAYYYRQNYLYGGTYYTGWDDYYNYSWFSETGAPVFYGGFTFTATGPRRFLGSQFFFLGSSKGDGSSGVPHHVKVTSDQTITRSDCGSLLRLIDYQVQDVNSQPVGELTGFERYFDYATDQPASGFTNTCTGSFDTPQPSSCAENQSPFERGVIPDSLGVTCPVAFTGCGLPEYRIRWYWCRRNGTTPVLFQAKYRIKSNQVLVNGLAGINGAYLYP